MLFGITKACTSLFITLLIASVSFSGARNGIPGIEVPTLDENKVIPIVKIIPGKLVVDSYALESVLDKIGDRPFGVYSINGPSRSGKSYLISQFVNYLNGTYGSNDTGTGFEWRGAADRCTRGINLWSDPFEMPISVSDGSTLPILLVDTQGCFDDKSPLELDAKLFAVSTLLSSVQIFNTIRTLDEATLQFLEAFVGVASMSNTLDLQEDPSINGPEFQKLIILIRDFQFRDYAFGYYDNTKQPQGEKKNFKLDKLHPQVDQPEGHQRIRLNILESFQQTAVYLMPHPGKELTMYDDPTKLDEDFKKCQDDLVHLLFDQKYLIPKKLNGKVISGTEFKLHVAKWTEVLQKIENLKLPKTSEGAAEIQYLTGIELARKEYLSSMDNTVSSQKFRLDGTHIKARHQEVINSLCKSFESKLYFRKQSGNSQRFRLELEEWSSHVLPKYYGLNGDKHEYWVYHGILAWKQVYPYLMYVIATLVLLKLFRWLIGI